MFVFIAFVEVFSIVLPGVFVVAHAHGLPSYPPPPPLCTTTPPLVPLSR